MVRLERALELLKQGKRAEARQLLELLLRENPNEPDILYNLGMLCTEMHDPKRAIELLERCIRNRPGFANSWVALGFARYRTDDNSGAIEALEQALQIEPDNPYAHRNLGGVYGNMDDFSKAIVHLEKARAGLASDPATAYGLGHAYLKSGDLERADPLLREVIESGAPDELKELAKTDRTFVAADTFKAAGVRLDAIAYCLGAMERFDGRPEDYVRDVSFEIAKLGTHGLDVNNPESRYTLHSLPGTFTGLHLVCIMYVGFKIFEPSLNVGMDLSKEYSAAQQLFKRE